MPKQKINLRATFKSYLETNGGASPNQARRRVVEDDTKSIEELQSSIESSIEDSTTSAANAIKMQEPDWLPGETVVSNAQKVMRYSPYTDKSNGESGNIYVTTFRVKFVPYHQNPEEPTNILKNKLIGEDDVALSSIESVYQVSKGKRKKLLPGGGTHGVKTVEIYCKNFRLHTFGFPQKDDGKRITDTIVHHCHPNKQTLMFAFDYVSEPRAPVANPVPTFQRTADWEDELTRLNIQNSFKVAECNSNFMAAERGNLRAPGTADETNSRSLFSLGLPEYFVVPKVMQIPEITNCLGQFESKRIPVWCYTHSSGASLVRAAHLIPKAAKPEAEKMIYEYYERAHPKRLACKVYELSEVLPSVKDIQTSYEKLLELCMPITLKSMETADSGWYSSLDSCKWLSRVTQCMKTALRIADLISRHQISVIIKEPSCRDLAPLLSCLVQLLLDPYFRTRRGFQCLVEREWVAMGHKFADRLGLLNNPEAEQGPVFLLFLDCVFQLQHQFPSSFQFSEIYLTTLWDSVCLGLFYNFIFNSAHDYKIACKKEDSKAMNNMKDSRKGEREGYKFMSVWDWENQFDNDAMSLFINPLYKARTELGLMKNNQESVLNGLNAEKLRDVVNKIYTRRLNGVFDYVPEDRTDILRPVVGGPRIKLWSMCYLRWLTPVEILGGGAPMEYLHQCILVEEILVLKHKLSCLEKDAPFDRSGRPTSDLIFSEKILSLEPRTPTKQYKQRESKLRQSLTSSFPFTPNRNVGQISFFGSPLQLMYEKSSICGSMEELSLRDDSSILDASFTNET